MDIRYAARLIVSLLIIALGASSCSSDKESNEPAPPVKSKFTKRYNAGMTFYSNTLQQQITYNLLLPEEYLTDNERTFDVMYLFHGFGDTPSTWDAGHFDIQRVDASARAAGMVRPIIYVMPQGFNSYYVNSYDGKFNYMDMLTKELIPLVDRMLRTNTDARNRAVCGCSMGGFGALAVASKNPSLFGTCVGLSPSLNTDEQYRTLGAWDSQWGSVFGGVGTVGDSRLTSHYRSLCPLHFFNDNPSQYASINYLIDCGDDEERLYIGNGELHSLMRDNGIRHEYRVRNGAHTTSYWREGILEGLALFEATLSGSTYAAEESTAIPAAPQTQQTATADGKVTILTGAGYQGNQTTHVIYFEVGNGPAAIDSPAAAQALSQMLSGRNCALAVFKTADMAGKAASDIFAEVETALGLTLDDSKRQLMVYGKGTAALVPYAFSGASIGGFYAEDSDFAVPDNAQFKSRAYILDLTDMGTNYKEMLAAFRALRDNDAPNQYRVRNGQDNLQCAQRGIASMTTFMNLPVR